MMDTDALTTRLERFWAQEIPLVNAMQVTIDAWDGEALTLSAALAANRNDKNTAFGGSLYALAVLAGWGLIMLRLWQAGYDCDVVIQHAEVDYLSPVRGRLVARCHVGEAAAWQAFAGQIRSHGKARVQLGATVAGEHDVAMKLRAKFVAIARA